MQKDSKERRFPRSSRESGEPGRAAVGPAEAARPGRTSGPGLRRILSVAARCRVRMGAVLLVAAVGFTTLASSRSLAEPPLQQLDYVVLLRDTVVAEISASYREHDDTYFGEIGIRSRGLARVFAASEFSGLVQGFLRGGELWPQAFSSHSRSNRETLELEAVFHEGFLLDLRIEPAPSRQILPAHWGAVTDPASAFFGLARPHWTREVCAPGRIDTFSGPSRVTVEIQGATRSPHGNIVCTGTFVQRAGPGWEDPPDQEIPFRMLYTVWGEVAQLTAIEGRTRLGTFRVRRR